MWTILSDTARFAAVIQGLLLMSAVIGVMIYYVSTRTPGGYGLLRFHVVMVTVMTNGLIGWCCAELILRVRQPITWRTPTAIVLFTFGWAAIVALVIHLLGRNRRANNNKKNNLT